jgi:nicotinamidase-related amidase
MKFSCKNQDAATTATPGRHPLLRTCTVFLGMLLVASVAAHAQIVSPAADGSLRIPVSGPVQERRVHEFNLSAQDVQILFVDLQPELTSGSRSNPPQALAANAAVLAKVARLVNVPVTFSIVPVRGEPGRHIPELSDYARKENTFHRVMAGTFMEQPLVSALAAQQRKVLVVSGYATEVAVLQTALGALKAGYTVYIAVDATGSPSSRTETAALRQMELAGAIPSSVLALAAQLAPDFSRPPGSSVLTTFDALRPSD